MCCCWVTRSCLTFSDPIDCNPPGSSVHGISQARILEWVAISFLGNLPNLGIKPASPAWQVDSLPHTEPLEKPLHEYDRCSINMCWMINETFRFQHKFNFLKEASFQEKNYIPLLYIRIAFYGLLQWLRSKKSTCNAGDTGDIHSILGSERSPGEGNGNPLQYSLLENAMDRGGWWTTVHSIAKSWTWLQWLSMHSILCRRHKFHPWAEKMPWRKKWQPTLVFLPGKSHGQRSLAGYSPRSRKRVKHSLTTKQQQQK